MVFAEALAQYRVPLLYNVQNGLRLSDRIPGYGKRLDAGR
jgi:hypothetical protein